MTRLPEKLRNRGCHIAPLQLNKDQKWANFLRVAEQRDRKYLGI